MTARRRPALQKHQQTPPNTKDRGDKAYAMPAPSPRVINAAPSLEKAEMYGIDDNRPVFSRVMALAGRMFIETIPQWLTVGFMLALIFGGCCSNVFALESIIKVEPASGMFLSLVTSQRARCASCAGWPCWGRGGNGRNGGLTKVSLPNRHALDLRPIRLCSDHRSAVAV
jgi:hypothetical protein